MESSGRIVGITRDIASNKLNITFQLDSCSLEEINRLSELESLTIKADKMKKKRSLDANGLLWLCLGRIANSMNPPIDKWDAYLLMLKRYGKYTYICVKPNVVDAVKSQWRECEEVGRVNINGQEAVQMLCYFGSSTMDTKEFSTLLNGVISEMSEMGLQTPTSEDMRRSLELWEKKNGEA